MLPASGAKIEIRPDGINAVGDAHTFTVIVMADDGLPAGTPGGDGFDGFGPAPGASVNVRLDGIHGAVPDLILPTDLLPAESDIGVRKHRRQRRIHGHIHVRDRRSGHGKRASIVNFGGELTIVETDGLANQTATPRSRRSSTPKSSSPLIRIPTKSAIRTPLPRRWAGRRKGQRTWTVKWAPLTAVRGVPVTVGSTTSERCRTRQSGPLNGLRTPTANLT